MRPVPVLFSILTTLFFAGHSFAAATLVQDINPNPQAIGSSPANLVVMNGVLYFSANDGVRGTELWRYDGTSASIVKDINPGANNSSPGNLLVINNTIYFTASEDNTGTELWKTDGTENGTVLVRDINTGTSSSSISNLVNLGGTLLFRATDDTNGSELWKSDGTEAGTVLVKDINTGGSSFPNELVVLGSSVLFSATDGTNGTELWISNGTSAGTTLLKNINTNISASSNPSYLTVVGSTLFFAANDGTNNQLWRSNGTGAGTVAVFNVTASELVAVGSTLFFSGFDGSESELWKSNGTAGTTARVADINPGAGASSSPASLTANGSFVFFRANDGTNGSELWKSDGTTTTLVKNINTSAGASSTPFNLKSIGSTVYFSADDGNNGFELWKSDGTSGGTSIVKNIAISSISSFPSSLTDFGGVLYFQATDELTGSELWKSNGTSAGTVRVANISSDEASSRPQSLIDVNGTLYFTADDGSGREVWTSNGTTATLVQDINTGGSSNPSNFIIVNGTLFFTATDSTNGTELWKISGGVASRVKDINVGAGSSSPSSLIAVGDTLYFIAFNGSSPSQIWKSDGTSGGTVAVTTFSTNSPARLNELNGKILFSYDGGLLQGNELWSLDPANGNAVSLVKDINSGVGGSTPNNFKTVGSLAYFTAFDPTNGTELWVTDGTPAGTVLVKDINSGNKNSFPSSFTAVGSTLYFLATEAATGTELWKTDGTTAGTVIVKDIVSGTASSSISGLINVNGTLFFRANTSTAGAEIWKSDGSDAGTVLIKDINSGTSSSSPASAVQVLPEGVVAFSATDGVNGAEIWKTNGNTLDTILVQDLVGGSGSSNPASFTVSGSNVFFSANNGIDGVELWVMPLSDFNNAVPSVTGMTPTSASEGSAGTNIVVSGSDFTSASVVYWNGSPRPTTVDSATQVTAAIPASDFATGGTYSVTVFTPAPGGGTSAAQTFTVNNLVPTLTSISPATVLVGSGAQTLTLTGTNFSPNSVVEINGNARNTTFVSSTQLTAKIRDNDVDEAGTADIIVTNPQPAGGVSSAVVFNISNPVPTLTSISPTSAADGGSSASLTITGTNFVTSSVVQWNGTARTTTFVSSTQLVASLGASDLALASVNKISVFNPTPGGGTSSELDFTVGSAPSITSSLAVSAQASSKLNYTITATGSSPITYTATNLPSGITLTSGVLSGTLTEIGSFTITLTATNQLGSDTKTLVLSVDAIGAAAGASNSELDSDGDGFSDEFEKSQNTSELNAGVTPLGTQTVTAPESLFITKLGLTLAFGKPGTSSLSLSGILVVPNGFTISGSKVVVDVGGVIQTYTLDSKGSSKVGNDALKMSIKASKGVVAAQSSKFSVTSKAGSWEAKLSDEGLIDSDASNVPKTVTVNILFDGKLFKADVPQLYNAKKGSSGKTKLPTGATTIPTK
ncbi:MAG TPA: ELWxxDGT repeat protein [Planctomycetota bacterium]|nr:ELWxxDGT repeat protein [Planctomycetota bacterium]